jgi:hypothetical protein
MATTPLCSSREELERFRFVCVDQMVVVLKYLSMRGNRTPSLSGKDIRTAVVEKETVLQDLLMSVWMMDRICNSGLGRNLHPVGTPGSEEDFICTSAFTSLYYTLTILEDEFHYAAFWGEKGRGGALRACLPEAFNFNILEHKVKAQLKLILSYKGGSLFCFDMYSCYDALLRTEEEQRVFRDLVLFLGIGHGLSFTGTKVAKAPPGVLGGTAVVADNGPVHWAYTMIQLGLCGTNWKTFLDQEGGATGKFVLSTVDLLLQSSTQRGFRGAALLTMPRYEGERNWFSFALNLRQPMLDIWKESYETGTEGSTPWPLIIQNPPSAHTKRTRCNAMA